MKKYVAGLMLIAAAAIAANEITVSTTLKVDKDALKLQRNTGTVQADLTGTRANVQMLTATPTNQTLSKGTLGNVGMFYMRNLSTNAAEKVFITFDNGSTTSHVLLAEEPLVGRLAPGAVVTEFTVATTNGTCDVEFTVIEE